MKNMTYHEQQAFVEGANAMLEWIDNSVPSRGGIARSYDIHTYQIRSFMKYVDKKDNYIFSNNLK